MSRRRARGRQETSDGFTATDPSSSVPRSDEVQAAAAAVEQARAALGQAEQVLRQSCARAAEQTAQVRDITVGDLLDGTLEFTRRHPVTSLLAAGVAGFLLGRATRR